MPFWSLFGAILESFWLLFGVILETKTDRILERVVGSILERFGVDFGAKNEPFWRPKALQNLKSYFSKTYVFLY